MHFDLDFVEVARLVNEGERFCLVRFHDGEHALMAGKPKRMASGWKSDPSKQSWLTDPLFQALSSSFPGYAVATSPPCCAQPATKFYSRHVTSHPTLRTFATLFQNSNYGRARRLFLEYAQMRKAVIVSSGRGDFKVPADAVSGGFDVRPLVDQLLAQDKPILASAGPLACVIGFEYWRRAVEKGSTSPAFIDVGSALDFFIHGRDTRMFHSPHSPLAKHTCVWEMPSKPSGRVRTGPPSDFPGCVAYFALTPEEARKKRMDALKVAKNNPNWARNAVRGKRK
jgi:hypothetical protein